MGLRDRYDAAIQVAKGFRMQGSAEERDGKLYFRGTVQSQSPNRLGDGFALHRVVDPMKVIRRQAGHVRERVEVDGVVEVIGEPPEHTFEPLRVVALRRPFVHEARW